MVHVLNIVDSHYSFNSSANSSDLYKCMFPDSQIAESFTCGIDKCQYLPKFGIAPYFANVLSKKVKSVHTDYVLLYDESHNKFTNQTQTCMFGFFTITSSKQGF